MVQKHGRRIQRSSCKGLAHTMRSSVEHHTKAADLGAIQIVVVTVSDTRTPETDVNAVFLRTAITHAGHYLHAYELIKDEPEEVARILNDHAAPPAQAILFNGGTGISQRDRTFDVLNRMLEKHLPGFGELFRMLSYEQVGAAAMLSRATAGVYRDTLVVSTPGSPAAVKLAWEKLIEPELSHLVWELHR